MNLLWIFAIIAVIALSLLIGILFSLSAQIKKKEVLLREAFWNRRNKLPLLIEVVKRGGENTDSLFGELIKIRAQVNSGAFYLEEMIDFEKRINALVANIVNVSRNSEAIRSDAQFLALEKELELAHERLDRAFNDYNYGIQKWKEFCKQPWFKIIGFLFESRKRKVLSLV